MPEEDAPDEEIEEFQGDAIPRAPTFSKQFINDLTIGHINKEAFLVELRQLDLQFFQEEGEIQFAAGGNEAVFQGIMTPTTAVQLKNAISDQIEIYEEEFGEIVSSNDGSESSNGGSD